FPLPFTCSSSICSSPAFSSFPSSFSPDLSCTSTCLPTFFLYWRTSLSGSSNPGEDTSREKSPSGYIALSSSFLYNALLIRVQVEMEIPSSASTNTCRLLVGLILTSTRKQEGCSCKTSFASPVINSICCSLFIC